MVELHYRRAKGKAATNRAGLNFTSYIPSKILNIKGWPSLVVISIISPECHLQLLIGADGFEHRFLAVRGRANGIVRD